MRDFLIVLPVINQPQFTSRVLSDIYTKTSGDFMLLIIDNGSTNTRTREILDSVCERPDTKIIYNLQNEGVAAAWNLGIEMAVRDGFEITVFLNNDITLPDKWDKYLLSPLSNEKTYLSSFCNDGHYWRGCWFAVKTILFEKIGKFTAELGKYGGEDTEFMFRMKKNGIEWQNVSCNQFGNELQHYGSGSKRELFDNENAWGEHLGTMQKKLQLMYPDEYR